MRRLLLYTIVPLVITVLVIAFHGLRLHRQGLLSRSALFRSAMPFTLPFIFLMYPLVTNVAFEAFPCYVFEDGQSYLVADVSIECHTSAHFNAQVLAMLAICIYPVGLFAFVATLLYRARHDIRCGKHTPFTFLYREYEQEYFFWELMEMGRRFTLVGLLIVWPYHQGTVMQLGTANVISLLYLVLQLQAMPYKNIYNDHLALLASVAICVIFLASIFYKYTALTKLPQIEERLSIEEQERYSVGSMLLTCTFILCIVGALVVSGLLLMIQAAQERHTGLIDARDKMARRLRWADDERPVILGDPVLQLGKPPPFEPLCQRDEIDASIRFHLFLSHVWSQGQDQMRIIKQRLLEMLPDIKVFLDVDDMQFGRGAEYLDASAVVLVFCSTGYFSSKNCMRELLLAVVSEKPIVVLCETDRQRGGVSAQEVTSLLREVESRYAGWGLETELLNWGYTLPSTDELLSTLYARTWIEWSRITPFQDVAMRLLAQFVNQNQSALTDEQSRSMEQESKGESHRAADTYLQGEMIKSFNVDGLLPPYAPARFHVYCSQHNPGSASLIREVNATLDARIILSEKPDEQLECERMVIYLNACTWTRGASTDALSREIHAAMMGNIPLLLCHEMAGFGQDTRDPCEFDTLFSSTPEDLQRAGIYSTIASPLKGGECRATSLAMVAKEIRPEVVSTEPHVDLNAVASVHDVSSRGHFRRRKKSWQSLVAFVRRGVSRRTNAIRLLQAHKSALEVLPGEIIEAPPSSSDPVEATSGQSRALILENVNV